jgi:AcrR family transcriptional regulator
VSTSIRTRYRRDDIVVRALDLLDRGGLAEVTMRRLAAELGVQASALYHHVPNKQSLLALMADSLLERAVWPEESDWDDQVAGTCTVLRHTLLGLRDGAELVATVWSFGLGASRPYDVLLAALEAADFGDLAPSAARTLLHFVYGHATVDQTRLQAAEVGAIEATTVDDDFGTGLAIVIAGIQVVHAARHAEPMSLH